MRKFFRKILRLIVYSPPVQKLSEASKKLVLPGFDGMPLYDVADFFFTGIQKGSVRSRASSVSYSFFLALFPGIIFLFTLIPYIPVDNFQTQLLLLMKDVLPSNAYLAARETIVDIISHQHGELLSIGFLLVLYFSTNGITALIDGFNRSYHVRETRKGFGLRLVAFSLTAILSLLVVIAILLIIFSETALDSLVTHHILKNKMQIVLLYAGKWFIIIMLFLSAISAMYYFGPALKKKWRFISPGSMLAAFLCILTAVAFGWFVNKFGNYNKVYGSIGTLIVIMLWIYYNSLILIIGFELNASIDNARHSKSHAEAR
jgi:membrane protein